MPAGETDIVAIAAGDSHSLALRTDGTVVGWGLDSSGQTDVPVGLADVVAISASATDSLALKSDGTVVAWGDNRFGAATVPTGLTGIVAIAAGGGFNLALKSDGTVIAWGDDAVGATDIPTGLTGVVAIAASNGGAHAMALKADGTVVAWGCNNYGQTDIPAGLSGVMAIQAGAYHSVAIKSDGSIVTWGLNDEGQLNVPPGLYPYSSLSVGAKDALVVRIDGTVTGWGWNTYGQLDIPAGLSNVIAAAAGAYHSVALIAPQAQAISLPVLLDVSYRVGQINLPGTASSDLPVSFSVTGPCTVNGSMLTIAGTGTCTITASQAGNANFAPAPAVSRSFNIIPAPLTVTASSDAMTYGGAVPTITAQYTGFVVGDTAASLTIQPSCGTLATSSSSVGAYVSTCSGAVDPNYAFTYVARVTTISPRPASVTPNAATKVYGAADPVLSGTLSGFLAADGVTATYARTAGETVAGSPYKISATLSPAAVLANYTITANTANFTITQAPTSALYTGDQIVTMPNAFKLSAQLTGPAACPVTYSLDRNPKTGAVGTYALGNGGSIVTTGWLDGAYQITVKVGDGANCVVSINQATLTVASPGEQAFGGGWYSLSATSRAYFGFTVQKVAKSNPVRYTGQLVLINPGVWRLQGTLTSYVMTGSTGASNGTGSLYWWNPALAGGHGDWALASASVAYTISFTSTTNTSPGSFGLHVTYTPVPPQPSILPNSAPMLLKGGLIN